MWAICYDKTGYPSIWGKIISIKGERKEIKNNHEEKEWWDSSLVQEFEGSEKAMQEFMIQRKKWKKENEPQKNKDQINKAGKQ